MCLFIPIVFGCPTKVKPDGNEQTAHFCPRCNNASVFSAKSRMWFELFWVPLIPFNTKHIWMCGVCQWSGPLGPEHGEPPIAYQGLQAPGQIQPTSYDHQAASSYPPNQK